MLKNIVNLTILTTIVIAVWVFVSIYNSFTSTTITTNVAKQIEPISPTFDTKSIATLQQKTFVPTDLSESIEFPDSRGESATESAQTQVIIPEQQPIASEILEDTTESDSSVLQ